MKTERQIEHELMLEIGKRYPSVRVFKNDTGMAFRGRKLSAVVNGHKQTVIQNPKAIHYGLFKGGSDLIGWQSKTITEDMVGQKVAVFVAIEVKRPKRGRLSKEQERFLENVSKAGGIAGVARNVDDIEVLK